MPLHPQAVEFLAQVARQKTPPLNQLPLDISRRASLLGSGPGPNPPSLAAVENRDLQRPDMTTLAVRIYVPQQRQSQGICLYFHGGGWVLNSIDTHDDLVRRLCAAAGCVMVSVDYRLAPEHKYPAAVEDAYLALNWVHDHAADWNCRADRIAVAGDSAGANLATVICLMSRDRGGPAIAFQGLVYPITDCDFDRPSYHANAKGYFLTRDEMQWFWNLYVSSAEQMREPYASPLRANSLSGLPAAFILTAEFDPLCDEGEAYAAALQAAGVAVKMARYDGMIHAFLKRVAQFDDATKAIQELGRELSTALQD